MDKFQQFLTLSSHLKMILILNKTPSTDGLPQDLMASFIFLLFFACLVIFVSCHRVQRNRRCRRAYTTQAHDLCQPEEKCRRKTNVCFCENDTEQLLSPHTYSLLRLWWLRGARPHINSAGSSSILGPAFNPRFLAISSLMTRPFVVGLHAVDGVSVTDHRHF